jgi:hypothetical protein
VELPVCFGATAGMTLALDRLKKLPPSDGQLHQVKLAGGIIRQTPS